VQTRERSNHGVFVPPRRCRNTPGAALDIEPTLGELSSVYAVTSRRANVVPAMMTATVTYATTVTNALEAPTSLVPPETKASSRSPGKMLLAVLQADQSQDQLALTGRENRVVCSGGAHRKTSVISVLDSSRRLAAD
jgi:hypothetical protein